MKKRKTMDEKEEDEPFFFSFPRPVHFGLLLSSRAGGGGRRSEGPAAAKGG